MKFAKEGLIRLGVFAVGVLFLYGAWGSATERSHTECTEFAGGHSPGDDGPECVAYVRVRGTDYGAAIGGLIIGLPLVFFAARPDQLVSLSKRMGPHHENEAVDNAW